MRKLCERISMAVVETIADNAACKIYNWKDVHQRYTLYFLLNRFENILIEKRLPGYRQPLHLIKRTR